jgi:hypothetical protein
MSHNPHIVEQVIQLINSVNIDTLITHSNTNKYLTDVTNGFQDRTLNGTGDPDDPITEALKGLKTLKDIQDLLKKAMGSSDTPADPRFDMTHWSRQQLLTLQQTIVSKLSGGDSDKDVGTVLTVAGTLTSAADAYGQQQLAVPQALEKSEQGLLSTDPQKIQVSIDVANSFLTWLALYASLPRAG